MGGEARVRASTCSTYAHGATCTRRGACACTWLHVHMHVHASFTCRHHAVAWYVRLRHGGAQREEQVLLGELRVVALEQLAHLGRSGCRRDAWGCRLDAGGCRLQGGASWMRGVAGWMRGVAGGRGLSRSRTTLSLFHVTARVSLPRGAMKRPLSTAVSSCSSNSTSASQWKVKRSGRPSRRPPPACNMIARRSSRFASYLG